MDADSETGSVPTSTLRRRRRRRRRRTVALVTVGVIGAGTAVAGSQLAGGDRSGTFIETLEMVQITYSQVNGGAQTFSYPFGVATDRAGKAVLVSMTGNEVHGPAPAGTQILAASHHGPDSTAFWLAGNGKRASIDGPVTKASFAEPCGVTVDGAGAIFVSDGYGGRIRKISSDVVTTVAGGSGSGLVNGQGSKAQFNQPCGLAFDTAGNLYVADTNNHAIRKMTSAGVVTTLAGNGTAGSADGAGSAARFTAPWGLAVDTAGNVFVADSGNHRIRKITPTGVVTTIAGSGVAGYADGMGTQASFANPSGIAVRRDGTLFVADTDNHRIRRIAPDGTVTTLAGSGTPGLRNSFDEPLTNAQFSRPYGISLASDISLYVADTFNGLIRTVVFRS